MSKKFILQDPGEGIHEAEILEVQVSEGDEVEEGETVLVIETDKAAIEVPAPFNGSIESIKVNQGDIAEVGDVLMTYTEFSEDEDQKEKKDAADKGAGKGDVQEEQSEAEAASEPSGEKGPSKKDAEKKRGSDQTKERAGEPKGKKRGDEEGPVPASPSTRRLARELGVVLEEVEPSGPAGRVTASDVRAYAEKGGSEKEKEADVDAEKEEVQEKVEAAPSEAEQKSRRDRTMAIEAPPLPDFSQWGEVERVPLRSVRRTTARHMALAWSQIPHVMHMDVADITALEAFRKEHKEEVQEEGGQLSLTVLIIKALVAVLKEFPRFNASLDLEAEDIVLKHYYHLGIAVDTEKGLLVPVVRDVDRKSIAELAIEISELVKRTREGGATREEMQGGTFTVTNPGPLGGTALTPIINYPQVAILGVARAQWKPVIQGHPPDEVEVVPRLQLPLCLAFDHRVNDGADAARFVSTFIDLLSEPESLIINV